MMFALRPDLLARIERDSNLNPITEAGKAIDNQVWNEMKKK